MNLKLIELRIGSWVEYQGRGDYYQVTNISSSGRVGIEKKLEKGGTISLEVPIKELNGIKFTKEILSQIEGYQYREKQEEHNHYLISLLEDLHRPDPSDPEKSWIIDYSLSIRELEGSWWVNVEESSISFETMGEGEFYFLHDFQNIISTFINLDIVWNNLK